MSHSRRMSRAAALALSLSWAGAVAQEASPVAAEQPEREAEALAALERMGATLSALQAFSLRAETTGEEVLTTGQKLQFGETVEITARRPNGLRIDLSSDRRVRSLYYDGRTIAVVAPRLGYYATVPAAPTIREMLDGASERFGLEFPLADLFTWGVDPEALTRITSAFLVGTETIGGHVCEHYALRQEGVDWQLWIRRSDQALPCKTVITTTDDPSMPQYSALFTWKVGGAIDAGVFTYAPPEDAVRIAIQEVQSEG